MPPSAVADKTAQLGDPAGRADPGARRRHGDADSGPGARRSGRARRAVRRPPQGPEELRRHPLPHAARRRHGDSPPVPGGGGRHRRDEHVRRQPRGDGGVRPAAGAGRRRSTPRRSPVPAGPPTSSTERTPDRPRFVAGSIGPTTKQTAISTKVDDAGYRGDDVRRDGRVVLRPGRRRWSKRASTSCCPRRSSTRSTSRRACSRIEKYFDERGRRVPVMVSGTFDKGGATFVSGQSIEAFWNAVSHFPMLTVGMNCALGPDVMRPHIEELPQVAHGADQLPSQRRPAERDGPVRPRPRRRWPGMVGEFAEQRLGEHRRRLLRHDAGAHRGDRRAASPACKPHQRTSVAPPACG